MALRSSLIFSCTEKGQAVSSHANSQAPLIQDSKKDLHDQDNHDGVITHLEPDNLECEVMHGLESNPGSSLQTEEEAGLP